MYRFKHILSELNLDEADDAVASYSSMITHITKSTELYFSHVQTQIHAREELLIDDDVLLPTQSEVALDLMGNTIVKHYDGNPDTSVDFMVKEGNQLKFLLKQIKHHNIDLMIIGRKPHSPTSRKLPIKLARKAPCSVLIVPEGSTPEINSIVVPVDFSHHAKDAVEVAVEFALAKGLKEITLLHLFQLPSGYSKNGKDEDEFCEIMKDNALEEYDYFIEGIDFKGIDITLHITHDEQMAHGILEEIKKVGSDLIIVGARGRSTGAGVLMGSVTEDMIRHSPIPILAVKDKARGMSFFESILRL
ncbi:MAG: universal stress protein [Bacteroidota bacterium]